jgi:hypothetical protein
MPIAVRCIPREIRICPIDFTKWRNLATFLAFLLAGCSLNKAQNYCTTYARLVKAAKTYTCICSWLIWLELGKFGYTCTLSFNPYNWSAQGIRMISCESGSLISAPGVHFVQWIIFHKGENTVARVRNVVVQHRFRHNCPRKAGWLSMPSPHKLINTRGQIKVVSCPRISIRLVDQAILELLEKRPVSRF